jgi:hypothetical protein
MFDKVVACENRFNQGEVFENKHFIGVAYKEVS